MARPSRRASCAVAKIICVASAVPNVGAPVRIEIAPTNEPMITGAPGRTSCVSAMPASVSASSSAMQPAGVTGPMAPASTAGTTIVPWLCAAKPRRAPSMRPSNVSGELELMLPSTTQCDRRTPRRTGSAAMRTASTACPGVSGVAFATLVAVAEERVLHVEVPLALGNVHRLDHAAAGEMDRRRDVGELDEVVQVLERAVAPAAVQVRARTAGRRPAKTPLRCRRTHAALPGCARAVELARRGAQQLARHATRNAHAFAVHVGAGLVPQSQRFRIAPELDPDFGEDGLGICLDDLDRLRCSAVRRPAGDGGYRAA